VEGEQHVSASWRQGHILPRSLAKSIVDRLSEEPHCAPYRELQKQGILVLISQDCDLVQPSLDKDPFAEAIYGYPSSVKVDENSTRAITLAIADETGTVQYTFEAKNRLVFPRKWLLGLEPEENAIEPRSLARLVQLIIRRYERTPLPTEFNNRLKSSKVEDKIRRLLKKNSENLAGAAIYLRLSSWDELDERTIYKVCPVAVLSSRDFASGKDIADSVMNGDLDETDQKSATFLGIIGLLKKCSSHGIKVEDLASLGHPFQHSEYVLSETQFTLDHLRDFKAWDHNYLSPDAENTTAVSSRLYR